MLAKLKKSITNELFLSNGLRELTFMTSTWEGCVCGGGNLEICLMLVDSIVFKQIYCSFLQIMGVGVGVKKLVICGCLECMNPYQSKFSDHQNTKPYNSQNRQYCIFSNNHPFLHYCVQQVFETDFHQCCYNSILIIVTLPQIIFGWGK